MADSWVGVQSCRSSATIAGSNRLIDAGRDLGRAYDEIIRWNVVEQSTFIFEKDAGRMFLTALSTFSPSSVWLNKRGHAHNYRPIRIIGRWVPARRCQTRRSEFLQRQMRVRNFRTLICFKTSGTIRKTDE